MSLAFQNDSESVKQAILELLHNLLSSENSVLQAAEQRMKQLEFTEGYGVYLSEVIMNQSFETPLRQIASIMLTRYVENHWTEVSEDGRRNEASGIATDQAKRTIRNILPNGLYDPNSKIRSSVAHTISTIASTDYPAVWTDLFDIIVKCLGGNEDSIHGAMQILNDFSYTSNQIKELGPIIISEVYRIFESEQNYSIKTRVWAIKILKSLFKSITTLIADKTELATMMESILTSFIDKLTHYLSMDSGPASNFLLRTEIIKVLSYLVVEATRHIEPFMPRVLPVMWQLLTQVADIYVKVTVNETEPVPFPSSDNEEDDEVTNFHTMITQILEFINCIIASGRLRNQIKSVLTDLIYITIVYIQVPKEQIRNWEEDPDQFVEDEDDAGVDLTVRMCGQDVLVAIQEEFEGKSMNALQDALLRHFTVAEAEKTAGNENWWKIQEASMFAVHLFRAVVFQYKKFDLINYLTIVRNSLNYHEAPFLIGRALWTLSTYSYSDLYNPQMFKEILDETESSLAVDKAIALRISAMRAVHGFMNVHKSAEGRALIINKLPGFLDGIIALFPVSKCSLLSMLLETITAIITYDGDFAYSTHEKIIPLALSVFIKHPEDPFIIESVQDVIKALCQQSRCLEPLRIKFIPTIVQILQVEDLAFASKQDIALDVLTNILHYSNIPLSEAHFESAFTAVIGCVRRTEDSAVMVSGGECLRAFINLSPETVVGYKSGEALDSIIGITVMLLNPMNSEMTAGQVGRLIITIITKVGNMLGSSIDMLLKAVISKWQLVESLKVIMSLVVIFAYLFLTQMEAALNFLSTVPGPTGEPALQYVLNNWLSKQSLFFGSYERRVTTMALCKLFEYGITSQDNRLTSVTVREPIDGLNASSGYIRTRSQGTNPQNWQNVPALVKIFKLLIIEWSHLKETKTNAEETDSDDTDDEDDSSSERLTNSPIKPDYLSDVFADEEEENSEDDRILAEFLNDPLFQGNDMEESLVKFFQKFTTSEHFPLFYERLNESERVAWSSLQSQFQ